MKINRFNENINEDKTNKIYVYNKLYGSNYNSIDEINNDLFLFDKNNIKYYIFKSPNKDIIGIFAYLPADFLLENIPPEYQQYNSFNNIEEMKKNITDTNKISKEELELYIQSNKFNL